MKIQKTKLGFTLIELLVVITIIGILATGAVSVYTSQIQKARDSTRITDVKSLQSGIEQFYQDTSVYPLGLNDWITGTTGVKVLDYLPNLAEDPKDDQTCINARCGYVYIVNNDSNGITQGAYEVSTAFENQGNITNKAGSDQDNGDDDNRLELGILTDEAEVGNNTVSAQGTSFSTTVATATTNPIHIVKSKVMVK